ncbi:MAG: flippase-like domain-containing protein [Acidimicrobiia bacterium]|nr:flippase-like domain-containing protein [Acidimicrobiia bacterium]
MDTPDTTADHEQHQTAGDPSGDGDDAPEIDAPLTTMTRVRAFLTRRAFPLRVGISLLLLGALVLGASDVDPSGFLPAWGLTNTAWLVATAALMGLSLVLGCGRWWAVLAAMDLRATRFGRLLSYYLAGHFVSNALPTTIGGDVVRVARLSKDNGDSAASFASVIIERLTGWLVLPVITAVGLLVDPSLRELGRATVAAVAVAAVTLGALIAILVAADHPRLLGRFAASEDWRRFAGAIHLGVNRLRRHPAAATNVVVVGLAYQVVLVLAATAAARALEIDEATVTVMLAFYPAVLIAQVLPIGIAGLGVREGAFVLFLTPLGVPPERAIALGLLLYLVNLGVSLVGAPSFATGGRGLRRHR